MKNEKHRHCCRGCVKYHTKAKCKQYLTSSTIDKLKSVDASPGVTIKAKRANIDVDGFLFKMSSLLG